MWLKLEPVELYYVMEADNSYFLKLYDQFTGEPWNLETVADIHAKWVSKDDPDLQQIAYVTIVDTKEGLVNLFFPKETQPTNALAPGMILLVQARVILNDGTEYVVPIPSQGLRVVKPLI